MRVNLHRVEIARGHDGFLRGLPEATLVIGTFVVDEESIRLATREVVELSVERAIPCVVEGPAEHLGRVRTQWNASCAWVVVALAIERDGGADVRDMYAAFADPDRLTMYPSEELPPNPRALQELHKTQRSWANVHLMLDDEDCSDRFQSDDFVAAAVCVHPAGQRMCDWTLRMLSTDARNDWRVQLSTCVR